MSNPQSGGISRRGLLRSTLLGSAASAIVGPPAAGAQPARAQLPIGMNFAGIADWEPGFPFLNLMWGARVWLTKALSGEGPGNSELTGQLDMDADGYPIELPFKPAAGGPLQYVYTLLPNILATGRYVILYDGEGILGTEGKTKLLAARPGRVEIEMQHGGNDANVEIISIRKSVRGNHVRNIRVLPAAYEHADLEKNPFRPEVLAFCAPWHCLRFVGWQQTNGSIEQAWTGRKRRTFYTQTGIEGDALGLFGKPVPAWQRKWGSGAALELCIQLANLTRSDAWLCVPHMADDDYIAQMAQMVKATLDPALKVYLEFSNEIWNWSFMQAQWMLRSELAADLVTSAGGKPPWKAGVKPLAFRDGLVVPGAGDGTDHPERIGALFRRCFRIWESVFQGADRARLVRVCTVQADWGDAAQRTLAWVMKNGGCDAFSPAGYFGPDPHVYKRWDAAGERLTADAVIADMWPMLAREAKRIAELSGYAKQAGVRLIAYEAGQHIQPEGQQVKPYNAALGAAQKHPGMYDLYRTLIDQHALAGSDLFCAFASVSRQGLRWGSWGHAEHYAQDKAEMPKYRAILEANTARARGETAPMRK